LPHGSRNQRTNIGAGRVSEGYDDHFLPDRLELEYSTVLVDQLEITNWNPNFSPLGSLRFPQIIRFVAKRMAKICQNDEREQK
jgi:hypothetical protein